MGETPTERPTHRIVRETYTPERLPDFDVFSAVIDLSTDTVKREVRA